MRVGWQDSLLSMLQMHRIKGAEGQCRCAWAAAVQRRGLACPPPGTLCVGQQRGVGCQCHTQPAGLRCDSPLTGIAAFFPNRWLPFTPLQARRCVAAMTDTERKLNAKLLRDVEAAAEAGTIPALRPTC